MRIRIITAGTKVATIVSFQIGIILIALGLGLGVTPSVGYAAAVVLPILMIWFCTRTFRGDSESVTPARAWWRMTERPFAGYFLAALFAAQGIVGLATVTEMRELPWGFAVAGVIVSATIAAAFVNSSIRLARS